MSERHDRVRETLTRIAAASARSGFEWFVLGGLPQAEKLYPDPAKRDPGGIDLLLPKGRTESTAHALRAQGFTQAAHAIATAAALARAGLRSDARVTLIDPDTDERVHLHERLFFVSPGLTGLDSYTPRASIDASDIPSPPLGAPMALDILLRGNARRWARPRWRQDLAAVIGKVDPRELIAAIEQASFAPGAAASLTGIPCPPEIEAWRADWQDNPEVQLRTRLFGEPLTRPHTQAPGIAARVIARASRLFRRAGQFTAEPATRIDRYPLAFRFAQQQLGAEGAHRLLSFGCSSGEEVETLRRYFPNATIKGIDIDPRAIAAARIRMADAKVSFEQAGNAATEPDGAYDAIFCMAVFRDPALDAPGARHATGTMRFESFDAGIGELVRALRPRGLIFVEHANFRVQDSAAAAALTPVLHSDPRGSGLEPGLYGSDDSRIPCAVDRTLGFAKHG